MAGQLVVVAVDMVQVVEENQEEQVAVHRHKVKYDYETNGILHIHSRRV